MQGANWLRPLKGPGPVLGPYGGFPFGRRREDPRAEREERARREAESRNAMLVSLARTRFKVGDVVLHEGRWPVRITEVHPRGYVSKPGSYAAYGFQWLEPVTCGTDVYRFVAVDPKAGGSPSGQTTDDRLSPMPKGTAARSR